ncbi:MAG: hypothetical protein AAF696_26195 [Bacteroidota bacterium]
MIYTVIFLVGAEVRGLVLGLVLLLLTLGVIAYYFSKHVIQRYMKSYELEKENHELEIEKYQSQAKLTAHQDYQTALSQMAEEAGLGRGLSQAAYAIPQLLASSIERMFEQGLSAQQVLADKLVKAGIAEYQLSLKGSPDERIKQLQDLLEMANTNINTLQYNYDVALRDGEKWRQFAMNKGDQSPNGPIGNTLETSFEDGENSHEDPANLVENPLKSEFQPGSKAVSHEIPQEMVRPLHQGRGYDYDQGHKAYYFKIVGADDNDREIQVWHRTGPSFVGSFWESQLIPGQAVKLDNIPKPILLCGCPGCRVVKIAQQPNTVACSPEHATKMRELKKVKVLPELKKSGT